jgi:hypothetical protein
VTVYIVPAILHFPDRAWSRICNFTFFRHGMVACQYRGPDSQVAGRSPALRFFLSCTGVGSVRARIASTFQILSEQK